MLVRLKPRSSIAPTTLLRKHHPALTPSRLKSPNPCALAPPLYMLPKQRMFDQVQQGLLGKVLDRSLLKNEAFASLIRAEDGEEYDINKFQDIRIRSFVFIVLTSARRPNKDLVEAMYTLRVMVAV